MLYRDKHIVNGTTLPDEVLTAYLAQKPREKYHGTEFRPLRREHWQRSFGSGPPLCNCPRCKPEVGPRALDHWDVLAVSWDHRFSCWYAWRVHKPALARQADWEAHHGAS
jgi:hypothetical protein